jgi:hypothetical protein
MALGGVTDCPYSLSEAVSSAEGSTGASFGGSSRAALLEGIGEMANTVWRTLELETLMRCDQDCGDTSRSVFFFFFDYYVT